MQQHPQQQQHLQTTMYHQQLHSLASSNASLTASLDNISEADEDAMDISTTSQINIPSDNVNSIGNFVKNDGGKSDAMISSMDTLQIQPMHKSQ
ncbi:hypothetical protein SAMD00019534_016600 [Acytostelium subglobosum LB1]|uniref:hypothetical protein n=1 Tax=Acytostelium subglobosum LB1 TaxID=1410327 RepID=UPI0006450582|nr:hypothetical protein SAMD00019534_016600 [Acytostelium subglobosum LB1]GAM18485.1 hypothetical protein SAMD00019534_016600 [Acytostelium subglobosum LB1]|eukprot:XP_012757705.1 hypothetical protein SAMD00019534_016600 [Acytostelium subglobosum LB1]